MISHPSTNADVPVGVIDGRMVCHTCHCKRSPAIYTDIKILFRYRCLDTHPHLGEEVSQHVSLDLKRLAKTIFCFAGTVTSGVGFHLFYVSRSQICV